MSEKRIFFAIPIPEDFKDQLQEIIPSLRENERLIPRHNWHVTVLFLGNVAEEKIPDILKKTEAAISGESPFKLQFKEIGIKKGGFKKMVWVKFYASEEFVGLCRKIAESLDHQEKSKFIPHITLSRLKGRLDEYLFSVKAAELPELYVKTLQLWESELSPTGAVYKCIGEINL